MNISLELQEHLLAINSKIVLSKTMDGTYNPVCAFCLPSKLNQKHFRVSPLKNNLGYLVSLLENRKENHYEFCHCKGLTNNLENLAKIIDTWMSSKISIENIKSKFIKLEKFKLDNFKNPNTEIESDWISVKNRLFQRLSLENDLYHTFEILFLEIKKREYFLNLFPYTSLNILRFSRQKNAWNGWALDLELCIIPIIKETKKEFHVNVPPEAQKYSFKNVSEAVDCYIEKLKKYKPES
jgi:hypothetical protein